MQNAPTKDQKIIIWKIFMQNHTLNTFDDTMSERIASFIDAEENPNEPRKLLLTAPTQCGKTMLSVAMGIYYNQIKKYSVINVSRNLKSDIQQYTQRATPALEKWNTENGHILYDDIRITSMQIDPKIRKITTVSREFLRHSIKRDPKIFISLFNELQITDISEKIEGLGEGGFVLIIDEADYLNNGNTKRVVDGEFQKLLTHPCCKCVINITATPLTTMFLDDIMVKDTLIVRDTDIKNYRGFGCVNFIELPKNARECNKVGDNPYVQDQNWAGASEKMLTIQRYTNQPHIFVITHGTTLDPHEISAHVLYKKSKELSLNSVIITWNADKNKTIMRCAKFAKTSIDQGKIKTEYDKTTDSHKFSAQVSIGDIIGYLLDNDRGEISNIFIFTPHADRAVTFASNRYNLYVSKGKAPWHITDQYRIFPVNRTYNMASIVQTTGRLTGKHMTTHNLTLWTNRPSFVKKAYLANIEFVGRVRSCKNPETFLSEYLPNMEVSKSKIPEKMRMTNEYVKGNFKKIDGPDKGWSDNKRQSIFTGREVKLQIRENAIPAEPMISRKSIIDPVNRKCKGKMFNIPMSSIKYESHKKLMQILSLILPEGWTRRPEVVRLLMAKYPNKYKSESSLKGILSSIHGNSKSYGPTNGVERFVVDIPRPGLNVRMEKSSGINVWEMMFVR